MRVLVLREIDHLNVTFSLHLVAQNEIRFMELLKHFVHVLAVDVVVSQQLFLYALWSVFQPSFAVCKAPEPDKQKAGERRKVAEDVVVKKSGFYAPCSHVGSHLLLAYVNLRAGRLLRLLPEAFSVAVVARKVEEVNLPDVR